MGWHQECFLYWTGLQITIGSPAPCLFDYPRFCSGRHLWRPAIARFGKLRVCSLLEDGGMTLDYWQSGSSSGRA